MSSFNCCFLTCIHISQEAGQVVWYFHLLKNFPVCCDPQQIIGFGVVNKAKVDVFLELSWFFDDPVDVGNLISGFSAFSKSSLNIWKFMVHILLKPDLEDFEHFFASVWEECNCALYYWALADLTVCTVEPSLIYCEMSVKLCYPVWGPPPLPATCGHWALEMWLVWIEMCFKYEIHLVFQRYMKGTTTPVWYSCLENPHGWRSLASCSLCDPMDCSLPGLSVHGILQARILEWVVTLLQGIFLT